MLKLSRPSKKMKHKDGAQLKATLETAFTEGFIHSEHGRFHKSHPMPTECTRVFFLSSLKRLLLTDVLVAV